MLFSLFFWLRKASLKAKFSLYKKAYCIFQHVGNVPGFDYSPVFKTCCTFHFSESDLTIPFEPKFIRIVPDSQKSSKTPDFEQNNHIKIMSSSFYDDFQICDESVKSLTEKIKIFNDLINTNQIESYEINNEFLKKKNSHRHCLLLRRNTNKMFCLCDENGRIFPIISSPTNLTGGVFEFLNIKWDLELVDSYMENKMQMFSLTSRRPLTIRLLSNDDCSLKEIDTDLFHLKYDKEIVYSLNKLMSPFSVSEIVESSKITKKLNEIIKEIPSETPKPELCVIYPLIAHCLILFIPLATAVSLPLIFKRNFSTSKNFLILITLGIFTIFGISISNTI